jgi:hypothetical protein
MTTLTPLSSLLLVAAAFPAAAAAQGEATPDPAAAVSRACAAAGGLDAFKALGTVSIEMSREEVTQAGTVQKSVRTLYLTTPGPVPGRLEDPSVKVVAGDDGTGGWALVGGQVDARPSTTAMVRRLMASNLFSALLPFSLTWEGVMVVGVTAGELSGTPTWRLAVEMERSFFHTPQISTSWTVDLDRRTFRCCARRALSPISARGSPPTGCASPGRSRHAWAASPSTACSA